MLLLANRCQKTVRLCQRSDGFNWQHTDDLRNSISREDLQQASAQFEFSESSIEIII